MTDKLNELVSALLDNELSDTKTASALSQLSQHRELRRKWERYHLIGDAMRGEAIQLRATEISDRVRRQLGSEPAIISIPKKSRADIWKSSWIKPAAGAALAASVATIAVISAPGFIGLDEPAQTQLTATNISTTSPIPRQTTSGTRWKNLTEPSLESRLNGYLVDHSEYVSPGTGIGVMPYATFVGYDTKR